METEEHLNKSLYKIELYLVKTIPIILSFLDLTNTVLSYFYIDAPIISYIGGSSLLEILFLYISSYVFKFCKYHRMFIHYILVNHIIAYIDYEYVLPIEDRDLFIINMIVAGTFLFIIIYLRHNRVKYID